MPQNKNLALKIVQIKIVCFIVTFGTIAYLIIIFSLKITSIYGYDYLFDYFPITRIASQSKYLYRQTLLSVLLNKLRTNTLICAIRAKENSQNHGQKSKAILYWLLVYCFDHEFW